MTHDVISNLLVKRDRLQVGKATEPLSKRQHVVRTQTTDKTIQGAEACVELCTLLLQKAGADINSPAIDEAKLHAVLADKYSPRALELLSSIANAFEKPKSVHPGPQFTESSDEEDEDAYAIVPSFEPPVAVPKRIQVEEAVVPAPPVPIDSQKLDAVIINQGKRSARNQVVSVGPKDRAYKKETEIAISRIFDLGKVASVQNPDIPADAPYDGPTVVSMTGFGELGRFGNQVLQYIFLKCYAKTHNVAEIQVPAWVGAGLFGFKDRPVQRALPPVVEFKGTLANSTFTTDFIDYVKNSNPGRVVPELTPKDLDAEYISDAVSNVNVDIWGWFQWHSSHYMRFKSHIQDSFSPVPALKSQFESTFHNNLRYRNGKKHTVVGLHLRLGDYQNIAASSFGYCAPTSWYLNWLAEIWPTLENPVLFVASDDLGSVLRDFAEYSPFTADSISLKMPETMKHLKAGFFPDWFGLTQCDVLAISNSTFSFSACMMNRQPASKFYRVHYKNQMVPFDPWNADPIVHRDQTKAGIYAAFETLQVVYNTQGSKGLARNLLYELPYYGLRAAVMKAVLWHQAGQKSSCLV